MSCNDKVKENMLKRLLLLCCVLALGCGVAQAVPALQLYIEGSSYDAATESWVTESNPFSLFVAGARSLSKYSARHGCAERRS